MATLIDEILRLLEQLTAADLEALPPAERERLAQRLRYLAEQAGDKPKSGVLGDLGEGGRGD